MDSRLAETGHLIRTLSRRQWMVSLAVVCLAIGSLAVGWIAIERDAQAAEIINLAGRQRMLSQRLALHLVLHDAETDPARRKQHHDTAATAANEFEQAHDRLIAHASKLGPGSQIHAAYFGPAGQVDEESRRYVTLVRSALAEAAANRSPDLQRQQIIAAAGDGLIRQLHDATMLYQQEAERSEALMLRLLQVSTLLIVGLVALGLIVVFRPVIRRMADGVAGWEQSRRDLQDSEERFKAFSEASSDWFWQTDEQHRFCWMQDGANVSTPMPFDAVKGKTRIELLSDIEKADEEKWRCHQADLDAHRPFRDLEYQIGRTGEVLRWISVNGRPFFAADGRFLGYRGTARHIQSQKEVWASHLRLLQAIEQSPVSISIIGFDGKITYVNAHFSSVTGYSPDEAIGTRPKALLWSGETPESVFADMLQTLKEKKVWRGEVCGRAKNGALFWETLSVSPVCDDRGTLTHHIAVSEDITAQRKLTRREQGRNKILEAIAKGTPLRETLSLMVAMAEAELPGALCALQPQNPAESTWQATCSPLLSAAFAQALATQVQKVGAGDTAQPGAGTGGITIEDMASDPLWQVHRELAATEGLRIRWAYPVTSSTGTLLGTLSAYYGEPHSPGADELRVVEQVASLAAICLEKNEAEQSLRRQEAQTRKLLTEQQTILGNALVGIVYLKHRVVVSCNRRLEEIFGYDPGELIGKSSAVFYDTHESFDRIGDEAYREVAEDKNYSTELILKHKNGRLFHGALNGCALDPAHPQEGSIWVYADITERYLAEQEAHKLLQAVEQSPASIVITNPEGLIEYVNPRFTKVAGYSLHEVLGQNPRILQSGETPLEVYQELWQTILAGREWRGIVRNKRKNGELFWEEASISPIIDETGKTTHYLAVKEDITDRKRIEDELEQHRTHLEDLVETRTADLMSALQAAKVADEAKDAFLANVSHELRTPLNAVIGLSELARRISTDPKQQDYLDKVTGAGKSLAGIINDLLDLSKIAAGHMEFESSGFSLRSLVQRSRSVMAHRAQEKGLALIDRIDADVPEVLRGDPLRIEQILLNLLSNAIKFTLSGRVDIHIGVQTRDGARVCLRIDIIDTGIGMAEESLARLFQPFAQADASMSRKFGGTGLGLALSRRLAEMMGGDIGVTSREGVGTTFSVKIWLDLGDVTDLPETEHAARKAVLPASYRNVRVLVVDDQPLNREIVEALLETVGITSRTAADGQEALDILKEAGPHTFDLVLMDIQMPIMDGLTATREVRGWSRFDELPIIAMTAHTMEHEKTISTAAGMNDHIGKPFETANFFQLLARWIPAVKQQMPTAAPASAGILPAGADSSVSAVSPPPVSALSLPSIDTAGGLARFVGNEQRYRHWLLEFAAEAPAYAAQMRQNLADGNPEAARKSAHAIKGRVGMLGMSGLHPIVSALEAALKSGEPATDLLAKMEANAAELCAEIQSAFSTDTPQASTGGALNALAETPAGPLPESVAQLITLLRNADGESTAAALRCLAELQRTGWEPHLQQALAQIRRFDFDAALQVLAPDEARQEKVD